MAFESDLRCTGLYGGFRRRRACGAAQISAAATLPALTIQRDDEGALCRAGVMVMDVTLYGGPLDGMVLAGQPITADPGAYMIVPGWEKRAIYEPEDGTDPAVWRYRGDIG